MSNEIEQHKKTLSEYDKKVNKEKLKIVVFGPGKPPATTADTYHEICYNKRLQIKKYLTEEGHEAFFPEELLSSASQKYNPETFELSLIKDSDLTILLRTSIGTTAEFGSFSKEEDCCHKLYILRDTSHREGYTQQGPDNILQAKQIVTGVAQPTIQDFTPEELKECKVVSRYVKDIVSKIQQVIAVAPYRKY